MTATLQEAQPIHTDHELAILERFYEVVRRTPIECAVYPNVEGRGIDIKLESEQAYGSFKARGAAMEVLTSEAMHFVTASAGSYGKALAGIGKAYGKKVDVISTHDIPVSKATPIIESGAMLVTHTLGEPIHNYAEAQNVAAKHAIAAEAHLSSPFNSEAVVAGNMTLFAEILEEYTENTPVVLFPSVGGGGQAAAACMIALQHPERDIHVVAVQFSSNTSLENSLSAGRLVSTAGELDKTCEGTAVETIGELPFEIMNEAYKKGILEFMTVSRAEVGETIYFENLRRAELVPAIGEKNAYENFPESTGFVSETGARNYAKLHLQGNEAWVAIRSGANTDPDREMLLQDTYRKSLDGSMHKSRIWNGPQLDAPKQQR